MKPWFATSLSEREIFFMQNFSSLKSDVVDFPGGPAGDMGSVVREDPTCCRAAKPVHG